MNPHISQQCLAAACAERQRGAAELCGADFGRREYCPEGLEDRPRTRPVVLGDPRAFPLLAAWALFRGDQAAFVACEQMSGIELVRQCCPGDTGYWAKYAIAIIVLLTGMRAFDRNEGICCTPARCARSRQITFAARPWACQSPVCVASSLRSAVSTDVDWRDMRMEDDEVDDDEASAGQDPVRRRAPGRVTKVLCVPVVAGRG